MSIWKDQDYLDLAIAAEDIVRDTAYEYDGLANTKSAGRALQALMADSEGNYRNILERIPQIMRDNDAKIGGLQLSNALQARERYLTGSLSTGPGMEFHHWIPNAAVHDATKYMPGRGHALFHEALSKAGLAPGSNPQSGVSLSAWGHRLGPNNAHINPETGGTYAGYYGTRPIDMSRGLIRKEGDAFVRGVAQQFIDQKALPSMRMALDVYNREAPLRAMFEQIVGTEDEFKSVALQKKALKEMGVTEEQVMDLAKQIHGSEKPVQRGKSIIYTPSWRKVRRPGAKESVRRVLAM